MLQGYRNILLHMKDQYKAAAFLKVRDLEKFRKPVVKFRIIRKPYTTQSVTPSGTSIGTNTEFKVNIALMHMASVSPLLVTEIGTHWTDPLIAERLANCA